MSDLKESFGRNFNFPKEARKRYEALEEEFVFQGLTRKHIFMCALALAYKKKLTRKPITRYPLLNTASFSNEDLWLIAAIAVEETNDLEVLGRPDEMRRLAEELAMAGLGEVENLVAEQGTAENILMCLEDMGRTELNKSLLKS